MQQLYNFVNSGIGCAAVCSAVFVFTIILFITDGAATEKRVKEFFRR